MICLRDLLISAVVGLWVCVLVCVSSMLCVAVCVCVCSHVHTSALSHFRNQLFFLGVGGDILTWSGIWCEVNLLLLLCDVAAARKLLGTLYELKKFLDSSAKQTHSASNVKVKWLSAGTSVSIKYCKITSRFSLFFFLEISFNLKPLSKTVLLADRHILYT